MIRNVSLRGQEVRQGGQRIASHGSIWGAISGLVVLAWTGVASPLKAQDPALAFRSDIQPILQTYCLTCHSTEEQKGELDLERLDTLAAARKYPKIWLSVIDQLEHGEMPPSDHDQPTSAEKARLLAWIHDLLDGLARERSGDPGPVVLRRLSNPEYTYTLRDLTGVADLDPAKEFPIDGAAGEGFMNTGQALVMSPSLVTKYLDAAKVIASHAVLLPDGIGFSAGVSRRDQSAEIVAQIRDLYGEFTAPLGKTVRNLQGVRVESSIDGALPLERYFAATLAERERLVSGTASLESVAREHGLNSRYLGTLVDALQASEPSLVLDQIRARWRAAPADGAAALAAEVGDWQKTLWKFNSVGHIGKRDGPKSWMEAISPLVAHQELRRTLPSRGESEEVSVFLVAADAGDGRDGDVVVWSRPRLVAPGRPDLLVRDLRAISRDLDRRRETVFSQVAGCLDALEAAATPGETRSLESLASAHGVKPETLRLWFDYLGVSATPQVDPTELLATPIRRHGDYDFLNGWGTSDGPYILSNPSGETVRIPGTMTSRTIAVRPTVKRRVGVGWNSPVHDVLRIEAAVVDAYHGCGNGVRWALELRRGQMRHALASGKVSGGQTKVDPIESVAVQPGDFLSLMISSDGDQGCDLTALDLVLTGSGPAPRTWTLTGDLCDDLAAANPRADRFGNADVWHFYAEKDSAFPEDERVIPAGSLLAQWRTATAGAEKRRLAQAIQTLLTGPQPADRESPDAKLRRMLEGFGGPLFLPDIESRRIIAETGSDENRWGLDPARFGQALPGGAPVDSASLVVSGSQVVEIRLPAVLAEGAELVVGGLLDPVLGREGSVQLQIATARPESTSGMLPMRTHGGAGTASNPTAAHASPIVVHEGSRAHARFASSFADFRQLFPAALCYSAIVPYDEVVTLTLFHREDEPLRRLMLDDAQRARLDLLWDQLRYVSHEALDLVDVFEQLWQYATQDGDPSEFEPARKPIADRAAAFRQQLRESEPAHLTSLLEIADRAYRRPLSPNEREELVTLYRALRGQEIPHDEAIRLVLARVFVSPHFLYRLEVPGHVSETTPVNDWELATRLSYFLWSSLPDAPLREAAAAGGLRGDDALSAQVRRMLADGKVRRLATEFACQWLHIRDFDTLDEKSERHFPSFVGLREAMYEESILFFTDLFQSDRSVLSILDSDHSFLNEALAAHYGVPGVSGEDYRRVDDLRAYGRGGILGMATTLAKHSGASRTSPILRGNWVSEVLLGEKLPRPPRDVPQLPADEATELLTVRELTARHSADPRCASCHARIDPLGFALEEFDAIGRKRDHDLGGRPIDVRTRTKDGVDLEGMAGLRSYLLGERRDAFLRQFNRKLLGYALGRSVGLSDEALLADMTTRMQQNGFRVSVAIETIILSRQFREIRGQETTFEP